jgi:hypothetical protein
MSVKLALFVVYQKVEPRKKVAKADTADKHGVGPPLPTKMEEVHFMASNPDIIHRIILEIPVNWEDNTVSLKDVLIGCCDLVIEANSRPKWKDRLAVRLGQGVNVWRGDNTQGRGRKTDNYEVLLAGMPQLERGHERITIFKK